MVGGEIENKNETLIVESKVDVQVFSFPGCFFFLQEMVCLGNGGVTCIVSLRTAVASKQLSFLAEGIR